MLTNTATTGHNDKKSTHAATALSVASRAITMFIACLLKIKSVLNPEHDLRVPELPAQY